MSEFEANEPLIRQRARGQVAELRALTGKVADGTASAAERQQFQVLLGRMVERLVRLELREFGLDA